MYIIGFIVIAIIVATITRPRSQGNSTNPSDLSKIDQVIVPPSSNDLLYYELAGIRIRAPERPLRKPHLLRPEQQSVIFRFDDYECNNEFAQIGISRVIYKVLKLNLDGGVDGAIAQVAKKPGVSILSISKESVVVDGLDGRQVTVNFRDSGRLISLHGLFMNRGSESWQIRIMGSESDRDKLEVLKKKIFESVELID